MNFNVFGVSVVLFALITYCLTEDKIDFKCIKNKTATGYHQGFKYPVPYSTKGNKDCTKFYDCNAIEEGQKPSGISTCPKGKKFQTRDCFEEALVDCPPKYKCVKSGYVADNDTKSRYYDCGLHNTTLHKTCEKGKIFSPIYDGCYSPLDCSVAANKGKLIPINEDSYCQLYINCTKGTKEDTNEIQKCSEDQKFQKYPTKAGCYPKKEIYCRKEANKQLVCVKKNGFQVKKAGSSEYIECQDSAPFLRQCPKGERYLNTSTEAEFKCRPKPTPAPK